MNNASFRVHHFVPQAFGHKGEAPNGTDVARAHLEAFMATVDDNVKILDNFAKHRAPALGWQPDRKSPVTGYPID
ncbi:hypothetical protein CCONF_04420 [Corynebacterium confusum]|nr:hypothetical protein CCONF_04420 [Corynebacterium confusum]